MISRRFPFFLGLDCSSNRVDLLHSLSKNIPRTQGENYGFSHRNIPRTQEESSGSREELRATESYYGLGVLQQTLFALELCTSRDNLSSTFMNTVV